MFSEPTRAKGQCTVMSYKSLIANHMLVLKVLDTSVLRSLKRSFLPYNALPRRTIQVILFFHIYAHIMVLI